jgi:prefoldin subunit 5
MKARIIELEGIVNGYDNQISYLDTTIKELESVIDEYQLKLQNNENMD